MSESNEELPTAPAAMQQLAWHATNGLPVFGILIAIGAESVSVFVLGLVVALTSGYGAYRRKKRGLRSAGEERLRLGPITPIPPEKSPMYLFGLLFFALCTFAMMILDDVRQLTKTAMVIMSAGVTVTFAGLMAPTLRRPLILLFALSLFAGGALILAGAAAIHREGADGATLSTIRTASFGVLILVGGVMTTLAVLQIGGQSGTPVHDTGLSTQWGFMPWSTLRLSFGRTGTVDVLRGTAFNGWTFQMPVPNEQMEALRTILSTANVSVTESI
ncbi:MAG: hypothetical protein R3C59_04510 [Planctomycetaceae bacterium]